MSVFAPYTRIITECFMACVWLVPLSILFKRCVCVTVSCPGCSTLFLSPRGSSTVPLLVLLMVLCVVSILRLLEQCCREPSWGICWWTHLCISLGDVPQREIGYSCTLQWKLPNCFPKGLGRGTVISSAGVPAFHIFVNTWYCRLCFSHSGVCVVLS